MTEIDLSVLKRPIVPNIYQKVRSLALFLPTTLSFPPLSVVYVTVICVCVTDLLGP